MDHSMKIPDTMWQRFRFLSQQDNPAGYIRDDVLWPYLIDHAWSYQDAPEEESPVEESLADEGPVDEESTEEPLTEANIWDHADETGTYWNAQRATHCSLTSCKAPLARGALIWMITLRDHDKNSVFCPSHIPADKEHLVQKQHLREEALRRPHAV